MPAAYPRELRQCVINSQHRGLRFTFLLDYINGELTTDDEWIEAWGSKYKTMSLHNDVLGPGDRQVAAETAYRRPAWYTLKRMNLILSQAKDVELLHSSQGAVVIRFTARRGFQLDGMIRTWEYLTMAWVDAYAGEDQGREPDEDHGAVFRWETPRTTDLELELASGDYVPGHVVPTVTPASSGTTDGFLAVSDVSWDVADAAAVSGTGPFRFVVGRMDPASEPAPTCIFSDEPVEVVSP